MTATAAKARCSSFLRSGRAARRGRQIAETAVFLHIPGTLDVKEHCIKDCVLIDPCCGSGGMFVQSIKFVEAHAGNKKKRVYLWPGTDKYHL
jgi:type I restriction-modification system DNA methylase subunit